MAEVDAKLAASLKQAKTNTMSFVFVAKGNEGKLLVDKKKISPKDAAEAKKECGGGTIYKGRCRGEGGTLVFEVGKEVPPSLPTLTKKIIKQDAALTFDVEYRVAADLAAEEGQGESAAEGAAPPAAAAPPAPPAPPGPQPARTRHACKRCSYRSTARSRTTISFRRARRSTNSNHYSLRRRRHRPRRQRPRRRRPSRRRVAPK
jgi:hypothetical protein